MNNSCCANGLKSVNCVERNNLCPECGNPGSFVSNFTVKNIVLNELAKQVGDDDYYLCMDEECDISYYSAESNIKFNKQQVKVPIWFKKGANPKYACYCSKVTEEQVINAVVKDGADNMKDVLKLTGAMKNPQCQKNNPLGKCCHQAIQDSINKGQSLNNRKFILSDI